ncbi:MAG: head GIN domain-containing protein [Bacteroidota bacterium]
MIKSLFRHVILFLLFSGLLSCEEFRLVDIVGDGNVKSEIRRSSYFDEIQLISSDFELILRSGEEQKIVVESDSNILSYVTTIVSGNQLVIGTKINFNLLPRENVKIIISYPGKELETEVVNGGLLKTDSLFLDRFKASIFRMSQMQTDTLICKSMNLFTEGSADVKLKGVFENFDVHQQGSGNISISGLSTFADYLLEGSGKIDSRKMLIENAGIRLYGSGLILCKVTGSLNARINGSGRIYYYGMPENLEKEIEGDGLVLPGN